VLNIKADHVVDAKGYYCPMPTVFARQKIREMRPGEIMEIVATDAATMEDVPAWCQWTGNEFLGYEEVDGVIHLFLRKGAGEGDTAETAGLAAEG